MYKIRPTSQFKKDFKKIKMDGKKDISELKTVVNMLANGETLPPKYKDHILKGNYLNRHECHIRPDWLLIYEIDKDVLILTLLRTGNHANLLKM